MTDSRQPAKKLRIPAEDQPWKQRLVALPESWWQIIDQASADAGSVGRAAVARWLIYRQLLAAGVIPANDAYELGVTLRKPE